MEKRLSTFAAAINIQGIRGDFNTLITGITYDSRRVKKGYLFCALPGIHTDGHDYIDQAIKSGAAAVLHSADLDSYGPETVFLKTDDVRKAMPVLAADFYGRPSGKLHIIGVTGTDGKSSTVSFIHQLLTMMGRKSGFLSTVQVDTGEGSFHNPFRQSTPEAPDVQKILYEMSENGCEFAVIEATSHGLSPRTSRLDEVVFRTAVFTNITHEHLEFHGSFGQYLKDKSRLFSRLGKETDFPVFGVVNGDDPEKQTFIGAAAGRPVYTYSMKPRKSVREQNDCFIETYTETAGGIDFSCRYFGELHTGRLSIPGLFNLENMMAALITVQKLLGCSPEKLFTLVPAVRPVSGRMNRVDAGQPFRVIIDYAHTPGSFSKVLPKIRETTEGKLIAVFGSAGERDTAKRPRQGEIAGKFCDTIILTDEDPRGEDPREILRQIASGCPEKMEGKDLFLIPDRKEAIRKAFTEASESDTVLLLGKGHETGIIYSGHTVPWNEAGAAAEILSEMGFSGQSRSSS